MVSNLDEEKLKGKLLKRCLSFDGKKIQIHDECKKKQKLYYRQISEEFRIAKAQAAHSLKNKKILKN